MGASIGLSSLAPRSTLVTFCPSDESFARLLADALSTKERDALARHVDGCASCQERLPRLAEALETETGRRAAPPVPGSEAEEGLMRRLKRMPPWLAPTGPMQGARPAGPSLPAAASRPVAVDREWPTVPGYEILGE